LAAEFKKEFNKVQEEMQILLSGGDGVKDAGADEAATALSSLAVKAEEEGMYKYIVINCFDLCLKKHKGEKLAPEKAPDADAV